MTAYLLDTNHAGALDTIGHDLRKRVAACIANGDTFYVSLPVITETVYGFSLLPRAALNRREWDAIRPTLKLIGMDERDALNAAALQVALRRHGRQLSTVDALIATTALRHNLVLLTTDRDFQSLPSLTLVNWMHS